MNTLSNFLERLRLGEHLTEEEASHIAKALVSHEISAQTKYLLLELLSEKGETVEELLGFAKVFRSYALNPHLEPWADQAIDVCGTGGDFAGSFNVSTAVAFIVASAGVPVFKHGNRSVSSQCGSADLLESLGIPLEAETSVMHRFLNECNFVFLFARFYHPLWREVASIRQDLAIRGKRTCFNLLGPVCNPGRPAYQMMGVYGEPWVEPLAKVLSELGLKRGVVVHSVLGESRGLDELSCIGENRVVGFGTASEINNLWRCTDFGLQPCLEEDLKGGNCAQNRAILSDLLRGKAKRGLEDTVIWNSGLALWIASKVDSIQAGIRLAREQLLGGGVAMWLEKVKSMSLNTGL